MKISRFFHIRVPKMTGRKFRGATVKVEGHTDDPTQVSVQYTLCSKNDNYCRATGRSMAEARPTKIVPLRYLPRELAAIEALAYGHEVENKNDFLFAIPYFLPKE